MVAEDAFPSRGWISPWMIRTVLGLEYRDKGKTDPGHQVLSSHWMKMSWTNSKQGHREHFHRDSVSFYPKPRWYLDLDLMDPQVKVHTDQVADVGTKIANVCLYSFNKNTVVPVYHPAAPSSAIMKCRSLLRSSWPPLCPTQWIHFNLRARQ